MKEFLEILKSDDCAHYFLYLKENDELKNYFPELDALSGVENIGGEAHKENFHHTVAVLKNACEISENPYFRFVALVHDLGKAKTKRFHAEKGWTFYNHEIESSRMVEELFKRYNLDINYLGYVKRLVENHGIIQELCKDGVTDSGIRRFCKEIGDDLKDIIEFCKCDLTTKKPEKKEKYIKDYEVLYKRCTDLKNADKLADYRLPINGNDIMAIFNLTPGRTVAEIKSKVEDAIKNKEIEDNREQALQYLEKLKFQSPQ